MLDLNYAEDSKAQVDMNIVMTGKGQFVELQGTGEEATFSKEELHQLLETAEFGIQQLIELQKKEALGEIAQKNWIKVGANMKQVVIATKKCR
ncbi:hypothetical protein GCM10020331_034060 [Ectobacillus funiculus]